MTRPTEKRGLAMLKRITAGVCAAALSLAYVGPAAAFDCEVAKKPTGAGSAFSVEFGPNGPSLTPLKKNPGDGDKIHGGFVTTADGDTFAHAPQGVLPPVREGGSQANCDGKGLDSMELCP
jgi:hypothetical protein